MALKPIKMLPARERVASVLRKAILSKELKEGEELTLEGISSQLGVSNTPIREAFQILANDGLIMLRPNKGALVLGINEKTIRDHYETRAILEKAAIEIACRKKANISAVKDAYELAREAMTSGNEQEYSNYNQAFHVEIWTLTENDKIKDLLSTMWNGLSLGHRVVEGDYAKISMAEHEKILNALVKYDEEAAGKLMEEHILRSMENMLTNL